MKWKYSVGFILLALTCMLGVQVKAESDGQYIVYLKQRVSLFSVASEDLGKRYTVMDEKELAECLSSGMVEFYEPDYEIRLFEDFNVGGVSQWSLDAINVSKAWDIGCYGNEVKVAVIDSGAYAHPDLAPNLLDGHNYMDNNSDTTDNIGHGTFVSGIIAAEANGKYVDGIAYHAKIVPLKCFDNGYTTKVSMIADAIYDAVDLYGCDVINMSFGMGQSETSTTLRLSIKYAQQKGCILVASVGNGGDSAIYYPAKYDGVIGVGAVDSDNQICGFSQRNDTVDVVAPGQGILSVSIPGFKDSSGTSFSAPHVSAMAAIAKCIDEDITPGEFQNILQATSTQLGDGVYNTLFGYGLINIQAMIDEMLKDTKVFISPVEKLAAGLRVKIYNNGDKTLTATGIVATYENKRFVGLSHEDINLPPGETAGLDGGLSNNVKFMLWSGFDNLKPLAACREK